MSIFITGNQRQKRKKKRERESHNAELWFVYQNSSGSVQESKWNCKGNFERYQFLPSFY